MIRNLRIFIPMFIILFSSCKTEGNYFTGKWQILKVVENEQSTDLVENWMHIKSDGTFQSYDGVLDKKESGRWTYLSKEKIIYIDGEGEEGDSEWVLESSNNTLIFHSTVSQLYLIAKKLDSE